MPLCSCSFLKALLCQWYSPRTAVSQTALALLRAMIVEITACCDLAFEYFFSRSYFNFQGGGCPVEVDSFSLLGHGRAKSLKVRHDLIQTRMCQLDVCGRCGWHECDGIFLSRVCVSTFVSIWLCQCTCEWSVDPPSRFCPSPNTSTSRICGARLLAYPCKCLTSASGCFAARFCLVSFLVIAR